MLSGKEAIRGYRECARLPAMGSPSFSFLLSSTALDGWHGILLGYITSMYSLPGSSSECLGCISQLGSMAITRRPADAARADGDSWRQQQVYRGGCPDWKSRGAATSSAREKLHELPGNQFRSEVQIVRGTMATQGNRRDERLPVQGREVTGRFHLARPQGYRRDVHSDRR